MARLDQRAGTRPLADLPTGKAARGQTDGSPSGRSLQRQLLVCLVILVFLDGALRKWALGAAQAFLPGLRDALILFLLLLALRSASKSVLLASLGLPIAFLLLAAVQHYASGSQGDVIVALLGVRGYVMWILGTFAFLMTLRLIEDWRSTLTRLFSLLMLAQVPIVVLQAISPPTAPINRIFTADGSDNLGVVADVVRTTGTFTSSAGLTLASIFGLSYGLGILLDIRQKSLKYPLILVGASLICVLLGGSRGAFIGAGIVTAISFLAVVVQGQSDGLKRLLAFAAVAGVLVLLTLLYAGEYLQAFQQRVAVAGRDDTSSRLLRITLGFLAMPADTPLLGNGLGLSSRASVSLGGSGEWIEGESSRIASEAGPFFGVGYILARIYLSLHLLVLAVKKVRERGPLPICLVAPFATTLAYGPITSQNDTTYFAIFSVAIALASLQPLPDARFDLNQKHKVP